MIEDSMPTDRPLRRGFTTGACATAAARAAFARLLGGPFPERVTITLPRGQTTEFAIIEASIVVDDDGPCATATVIKDAGDDPDVTHRARISVSVRANPVGRGITFHAGQGVGTVTRPGLPIPPGEPAINPVPRAMIEAALTQDQGGTTAAPDVAVTIAVANGEALAKKTMNARLGIVGGLSILGTTGIVIPYSCSAWIATIHQGIDVARASFVDHLVGCTGNTSEAAVRAAMDLPDESYIDMGGFAGALLSYLRRHPVSRLTIGGGLGKISKLAMGEMDLHSSRSAIDTDFLADQLVALGADDTLAAATRAAPSAGAVLALATQANLALGDAVAHQAREVARAALSGGPDIEVRVFDRAGLAIGHAPFIEPVTDDR